VSLRYTSAKVPGHSLAGLSGFLERSSLLHVEMSVEKKIVSDWDGSKSTTVSDAHPWTRKMTAYRGALEVEHVRALAHDILTERPARAVAAGGTFDAVSAVIGG
jgi:hypothetical protein